MMVLLHHWWTVNFHRWTNGCGVHRGDLIRMSVFCQFGKVVASVENLRKPWGNSFFSDNIWHLTSGIGDRSEKRNCRGLSPGFEAPESSRPASSRHPMSPDASDTEDIWRSDDVNMFWGEFMNMGRRWWGEDHWSVAVWDMFGEISDNYPSSTVKHSEAQWSWGTQGPRPLFDIPRVTAWNGMDFLGSFTSKPTAGSLFVSGDGTLW